jgi:hypothetical protein
LARIEPGKISFREDLFPVLDHPEEPKIPLARERAKKLRERIPFSG